MTRSQTLFEKIWNSHLVDVQDDGINLLYNDRHFLHEVLSPQAFEGLRLAGRSVRRRDATLAVADHNVPTTDRTLGIEDPESRLQVETLSTNCEEFGVEVFDMLDPRQGIVHVIGPEQGFTLPGTTVVCCDSHTATHGAFGALAFGIGTSESEHVLATQTLRAPRPKSIAGDGRRPAPGRMHRQGSDPCDHRADRHRRRHRPHHRVLRPRHPRPLDGRPHDGQQHDHRGRRTSRARRSRREDLRVSRRPADGAEGYAVGRRGGVLEHPRLGRWRGLRQGGSDRGRGHRPAGHLGHKPRGRGADHRRGAGPGRCAERCEARPR